VTPFSYAFGAERITGQKGWPIYVRGRNVGARGTIGLAVQTVHRKLLSAPPTARLPGGESSSSLAERGAPHPWRGRRVAVTARGAIAYDTCRKTRGAQFFRERNTAARADLVDFWGLRAKKSLGPTRSSGPSIPTTAFAFVEGNREPKSAPSGDAVASEWTEAERRQALDRLARGTLGASRSCPGARPFGARTGHVTRGQGCRGEKASPMGGEPRDLGRRSGSESWRLRNASASFTKFRAIGRAGSPGDEPCCRLALFLDAPDYICRRSRDCRSERAPRRWPCLHRGRELADMV